MIRKGQKQSNSNCENSNDNIIKRECKASTVIPYKEGTSETLAELPERLRTTLKRINERLIAVDGHPSVLAGDRFSLPLRGPIDLFNTCNSPSEISSTVTGTNGAERECQLVHCLQIYVVSVESVICLADILETVSLPLLLSLFSHCLM
ncbi:unnamed protein product [Trichobilharzia regenti]|nr:unnamed protein product [Trichobilharzia regenti]